MTTERLRADLDALPGVASVEVTLDDEAVPLVRVWLDGSLPGDDVRNFVDGLVADSMPSVVMPRQKPQGRRIGLGRGLGDLLPNDETDRVPAHLQPSQGHRHSLVRVAVVESTSGVTVEITSDEHGVHSEPVAEDGDIDLAVIRSVVAVTGIGEGVRMELAEVDSIDGAMLLVSAFRGDERAVGAAFVEYGRPYAIARAGFAALRDL